MTSYRIVAIGLAVCALLPATTHAQATYDFRLGQNFAGLETYTFKDVPSRDATSADPSVYDTPFLRERTKVAIAAQLAARGLRRDDERPDVYVIPRRTFKEVQVYYGPYGWGYPYGWGWGYGGYGYGGASYTDEITIGTLTIDLVKASTGELIWRGSDDKRFHRTSTPERRTKRVAKEVSKIFEELPLLRGGAVTETASR
jgi:hypothetical protein